MYQAEILEWVLDWHTMYKQTTKKQVSTTGRSPFSGGWGTLEFVPSTQGFISINGIKIEPSVISIQNGEHTTIVTGKGKQIKAVEHLLSAISGLGYHSLEVRINADEIPAFDGAAMGYVKMLKKAGKKGINQKVEYFKPDKEIFFSFENSMAIIRPSNKLRISALIQFPEPIGQQYFVCNNYKDVQFARTFIRSNCDKDVWKNVRRLFPFLPEDKKKSPIIMFENGKWVQRLRAKDEPVRHKILDFIGDISLLGKPVIADITLIRPGHEFNRKLVSYLIK